MQSVTGSLRKKLFNILLYESLLISDIPDTPAVTGVWFELLQIKAGETLQSFFTPDMRF